MDYLVVFLPTGETRFIYIRFFPGIKSTRRDSGIKSENNSRSAFPQAKELFMDGFYIFSIGSERVQSALICLWLASSAIPIPSCIWRFKIEEVDNNFCLRQKLNKVKFH